MNTKGLPQLSTLLAQMGQQGAAYDPGTARYMQALIDSGQSMSAADAEKRAQKKAEKDKKKALGEEFGPLGAVITGGDIGNSIVKGASNAANIFAPGSGTMIRGTADATGIIKEASPAPVTPMATTPASPPAAAPIVDVKTLSPVPTGQGAPSSGLSDAMRYIQMGNSAGGIPASEVPNALAAFDKMNNGSAAPALAAATTTAPGAATEAAPASGGGILDTVANAAPLIGAGLGAINGARGAYNQPVAAPKVTGAVANIPGVSGAPAGSAAQQAQARNAMDTVGTMKPGEFRNLGDEGQMRVMSYLQQGGTLTPEQARNMPREMKEYLRAQGYSGMPSKGKVIGNTLKQGVMGYLLGTLAKDQFGAGTLTATGPSSYSMI